MQAHQPHRRPLLLRQSSAQRRGGLEQHVEGLGRARHARGILGLQPRLEHHRVARRFLAGEGEIGAAERVEGGERRGHAIVPGHVETRGEAIEPAAGDLGEQRLAVAEMAVGRGGTDAGKPRRLGQAEAGRPILLDERAGGLEQDLLQIAVMIGTRAAPAVVGGRHVSGFYFKARPEARRGRATFRHCSPHLLLAANCHPS